MKVYLLSLAAGLLVGVIYSLLNVRSPAPPLVALVGLLGILVGEQVIPLAKSLLRGSAVQTAWRDIGARDHLMGPLPGRHAERDAAALKSASPETSNDRA